MELTLGRCLVGSGYRGIVCGCVCLFVCLSSLAGPLPWHKPSTQNTPGKFCNAGQGYKSSSIFVQIDKLSSHFWEIQCVEIKWRGELLGLEYRFLIWNALCWISIIQWWYAHICTNHGVVLICRVQSAKCRCTLFMSVHCAGRDFHFAFDFDLQCTHWAGTNSS